MADFAYPLFPICAFLGFICSLIPLPWHLQAWNSGTCYYMMWASLACLNQFINSITWAGNTLNHSPVWCDISIRILLASSVGLPVSSLCINRRLYQIASVRNTRMGHAEKSRAILIDTLLCVLFPLVYVGLQYVVQGHRFDIFEDIGCYPAIYNTLLTYFINSIWPIVLGLISAGYCVRTLCAFARRRLEFGRLVNSSHSSLTMSRYFRLMALAMSEILFTTPLAVFNIWLNATVSPIGPWRSWDDTHFDYSRIRQIPSVFWQSNHILVISIEVTRWVAPLCAFVFFAFFGFADEARRNYIKLFGWIISLFGLKRGRQHASLKDIEQSTTPTKSTSSFIQTSILPTYSPPPSFYPALLDIKSITRPDTPKSPTIEHLQDPCGDKNISTDLSMTSPTTTCVVGSEDLCLFPPSSIDRFSWKTVSGIPFSDRRHSSYF